MKAILIVSICALLLGGQAAQVRETVSPVTRVVRLLVALSQQIEDEGKKEEELYDTFVCWGKSIIAQKEEFNAKASARIDELETYIADLEAGRIELTTERQDREKEVAALKEELATAKALREKENEEYEAAKDEMEKGIKALESAIKVLEEATKDSKPDLLALRTRLNGGLASLEAESANLVAAVQLGDRYLTKADSDFLRRVLTGDVPERDEKMLRRKAEFKMKYKARSGEIQDVLKRLKVTFTNNLGEVEGKEKEAQDEYDKLKESKEEQLENSEQALKDLVLENGARALTKEDAQSEVDALKENVENDKKFIEQTKTSLKEKEGEWDERQKIRADELTAVSKAIEILNNDDSKDLFKKSFESQGYFFLQEGSYLNKGKSMLARAVSALNQIVRKTGDRRLSAIAALAADAAQDPESVKLKFKPIIEAIDKMVEKLKNEETEDLETKETCEKDRMEITRKALLAGRDIDEKTDKIRKLEVEIKELEKQIKLLLEEKKKVKEELEKATKIREDETALWEKTDKDDADAHKTVQDAIVVLKGFYAFLQKGHQSQPVQSVEGEAPPPPPPTWEGGYGTKKGESQGIIAILEMIHADIKKDQEKAKAEEDQSQKEYEKFKEDSEKHMEDLQNEADKKEGIKGEKETEKTSTETERQTKKGEWDGLMKTMKDTAENCEYYAVNYKIRRTNRKIEIDGLLEAKAVLEGASFKEEAE